MAEWELVLRLLIAAARLFMTVSVFGFADILAAQKVVLDLLRGEVVRGLTTAASLWTVAAIGLAVARGRRRASRTTSRHGQRARRARGRGSAAQVASEIRRISVGDIA
ncbi:MAG TPA: hypothetical protein VGG27_01575 [Magnetospirillaceae bacterium]|jgi:hypothetical protein